MKKNMLFVVFFVLFLSGVGGATGQANQHDTRRVAAQTTARAEPLQLGGQPANRPGEGEARSEGQDKAISEKPGGSDPTGIKPPDSDRLRIRIRGLAGYGQDLSNSSLGFENQGRVGYVIVELFGKLNDAFSYRVEVNPVNETQPKPSCGEAGYFYPNVPGAFGPGVACDPMGRMRVDDYRFVALDFLPQQGPIRQAYVEYAHAALSTRFGRFVLPIGFTPDEVGSFTAKDATHIQRINSEANFGLALTGRFNRQGRPFAAVTLAGFLGDGNRWHDYDYFYYLDGSLDSNSALSCLVSGRVLPFQGAEVRGAYKFGYTGSKVERLPNFYASKRNDMALVLSAQDQRQIKKLSLRGFGEYARYTWGPTRTSAELLGLPDGSPVVKPGHYIGGDVSYQVLPKLRVGTTITREELSRDDSLIKYLSAQGLYGVSMGKVERSLVLRFYADIGDVVTVGFYRNNLSNPFPQVSGIAPLEGTDAFKSRGSDKYGVIVRFRLP